MERRASSTSNYNDYATNDSRNDFCSNKKEPLSQLGRFDIDIDDSIKKVNGGECCEVEVVKQLQEVVVKKKKVARRRWAILAKALKSPTGSEPTSPTDEFSVRRISSFMLLSTQQIFDTNFDQFHQFEFSQKSPVRHCRIDFDIVGQKYNHITNNHDPIDSNPIHSDSFCHYCHNSVYNSVDQNSVDKNSVDKNSVDRNSVDHNSIGHNSFDQNSFDHNSFDHNSIRNNSVGHNSIGHNSIGHNLVGQNSIGQNSIDQNLIDQNLLDQNSLSQNSTDQNSLDISFIGHKDHKTKDLNCAIDPGNPNPIDFNSFDRTQHAKSQRTWYKYQMTIDSSVYYVVIGHRMRTFSAEDLMGFNNTGNICIWPSEETLTYYLGSNLHLLNKKRVLELGGGMSCLAGLMAAKYGHAESVHLTDGNKISVENVRASMDLNHFSCGAVSCAVLKWGAKDAPHLQYDVILCADCLFFDDARQDLVDSLWLHLAPDGIALVMAPKRGLTLATFIDQCEAKGFRCLQNDKYNQTVWEKHLMLLSNCDYDDNIHYPILLELTKE